MNQAGIAHILIVEDDPALQDVYKMILLSQGYKVSVASNGIDALTMLKSARHAPDIVLLDIYMPRMDGREFMKNLDSSDYPDMKIVVSSNLPDRDVMDEMLSLGARDYILKSSMSPNDLVTMVEKVLQD